MTDKNELSVCQYRQVKNPNPVFSVPEEKRTLAFCRKLMEKADGFTDTFDFQLQVAFARAQGKRHRMPPLLRRRAIDALLQGMCFYFDPENNSVRCSVNDLAIECGLATQSSDGALDISKATRALESLDRDFGLIVYDAKRAHQGAGSNIQACIWLTPVFFNSLNIFPLALAEARIACIKAKGNRGGDYD